MARAALIVLLMTALSFTFAEAQSKSCGKNQNWNICGQMCEPTCAKRTPPCPKIACNESTRGCRCNRGYYRNTKTRACVRGKKCPKRQKRSLEQEEFQCGVNEQFGNCGRMCEGTCSNPNMTSCISCMYSGCQCKQGYLRNEATDSCVPAVMCPETRSLRAKRRTGTQRCQRGETKGACGRRCEGTCESPRIPEICSRIRCSDYSCRCDLRAKYVRNKKINRCVKIARCPK